jgi:hypothetical protein
MTAVAISAAINSSAFAAPAADVIAQADELERRWAHYYLEEGDAKEIARLDAVVANARTSLNADGRFDDLTYGPIITGRDGGQGWGEHLLRVADLFTAWRLAGTTATGDRDLVQRAAKALEVYLAAPYDKADRWGFGHPYADLLENNRIGRCCLFARSAPDLFKQADVERWANAILERSASLIFAPNDDPAEQFKHVNQYWEGGANVLWCTRGELVPYIVNSDQDRRIRGIDGYLGHLWRSQKIVSPKGPKGQCERLTVDGMLGEHDVPCMGSYGEWYLNDVVAYRDMLNGIPRWQMPDELNAFWIDVLLDSVTYCYQGAIDPVLSNPLRWLNGRRNGNAKLREWLEAFKGRGHREAEIAAVLAWEPGVTDWPFADRSVKHYYTIDFMTKHYPRWMASVRAISQRTKGSETFAQKEDRRALESVLLPLGTCLLRRDTREFQQVGNDVFSAMDYARLPGQTTRHVDGAALASCWNRDASGYAVRAVFGDTPFSAGVAAPHTGVMGWWQSRFVSVDPDRTPAEHKRTDISVDGRRATFLLEDAIVHLGAGFDVRHDSIPTFTSVEQRLSADGATAKYGVGGEVKSIKRGETATRSGIDWAWYDDVGYLPPQTGTTTVQDVQQRGTPARQIFSVYTDHGRTDQSVSFDWAAIPGITAERTAELAQNRPWRVLVNTTELQAIAVPARAWIGAVFHTAGELKAGDSTIVVSRPCALIVEKHDNTTKIYAADPFETDGELVVTIDGRAVALQLPASPNFGATASAAIRN